MSAAPSPAGAPGADGGARRDLGAFYTPSHAVDFMVGMLEGVTASSTVLEPSGGDGAFVAGLARAGVPSWQVTVWDVDAACRGSVEALGATFDLRDSLLSDMPAGPFSHIVGNPPYLSKQSAHIKENKVQLRRRYADIGAHDTYAMFIARAVELLAPGGQLVFLVSDTFLTLGVHRKLREMLLARCTLLSLCLMPPGLFGDASVNTAVLSLRKAPAPSGHQVRFCDLRHASPGDYDAGVVVAVPQRELAGNPCSVFAFRERERDLLAVAGRCGRLMSLLDGGLGMYTKDNVRFLGVVGYQSGPLVSQRKLPVVPCTEVDGVTWRFYHKRGGECRWYRPAEHCVRWDEQSRAGYGMPATALAGQDELGADRPGFVVSGVSARLSARLMTRGAMWESNKAFGLFPKDPVLWPCEFFIGVLNSDWYGDLAQSLNHTVSLQIRDLEQLPLLPFRQDEVDEIARLASCQIAAIPSGSGRTGGGLARIEQLVRRAADRT